MQEAIYHIQPASQAAFLRKADLKVASYLTVPVRYDVLRDKCPSITIDAYDLYITLLHVYSSNSNEKFEMSVNEIMYKAVFFRPNTYHNAKNKLLTYDLIKIFSGKVRNSINAFKPKLLPPSCFFVPHAIFYLLNNLVRAKVIPRAGKLAFIFLYQQFVLQNYPEYVEFNNSSVQTYLNQSTKTYFRLLQKLKSEGLVEFSEIKNQHQLRQFKLFLPRHLPLPSRARAPRSILAPQDSQARLRQIMSKMGI